MNRAEAIAVLQARLELAEKNAERLRAAGTQEQYMESYFLVSALAQQLDTLMREPPPG